MEGEKKICHMTHVLISNNMDFLEFEPPEVYSSEAVLILQPITKQGKICLYRKYHFLRNLPLIWTVIQGQEFIVCNLMSPIL